MTLRMDPTLPSPQRKVADRVLIGLLPKEESAGPVEVPRGAKFWRARSRLYQNEILQENMRLTAFFKLYKICILLHRCDLIFFLTLPGIFWEILGTSQNLQIGRFLLSTEYLIFRYHREASSAQTRFYPSPQHRCVVR